MADNFINATGLATIKAWIKGAFASKTEFDALDTKVDNIISTGGEPNTIDSITVNGTVVTPDANKNVALTSPTATSELTNDGDGTSKYATENYVQAEGGKIDSVSVNGTALPITNKNVNVTVPVNTDDLVNNGDGTSPFATQSWVEQNSGKIDAIKVNGNAQTITNKEVDIAIPVNVSDLANDSNFQTADEVEAAINAKTASLLDYKGVVADVASLPATGNKKGDVYDVQSTGDNYAWDGTKWDSLGSHIDLSILWQKSELTAMTVQEINDILNA